MRLKVFHAADGDCLLLTSSDGHHALIDGGRAKSFRQQTWPSLQELAREEQALDLVVVSHVDADHIGGILWLLKVIADWTVFDFQTNEGGNPDFRRPQVARPPKVKKVWHNSWKAQLEDLSGPIEGFAALVATAVDDPEGGDTPTAATPATQMFVALQKVAESIPQGVALRRIVDEATPVVRNKPFDDLVLLRDPPHVEKLGKTSLTVLGPAVKHLEALREEWRKWLDETSPQGPGLGSGLSVDELTNALAAGRIGREELVTSLAAAAHMIAEADPRRVSPPNRASITLLAEERDRTCLLTGDAAEEEILEGLDSAGRIDGGRFRCNVLKVQHHGAEFNISQRFASIVLADHYVFCGDGASGNPEPSVVKTIVESRVAVEASPFTLWFNCSAGRSAPTRRQAMEAAIREARTAARRHPEVTVRVLDDDEAFFEIAV